MYSELVLEHARVQYQQLLAEAEEQRRVTQLIRESKARRQQARRVERLPRPALSLVQPNWRIV